MNTTERLPVSARDRVSTNGRPAHPEDEGVVARLARLLRLEVELGLVEGRQLIRRVAVAVAVAIVSAIALIASLVVLVAAAVAPIFAAPWQPLLIAGGGVALLSLAALAWSAWRLTHLAWPTETLKSFEENWRWLAVQLRSRLTLH
jgi:Putative Actinobacterial Holin-X, holin superfamily III